MRVGVIQCQKEHPRGPAVWSRPPNGDVMWNVIRRSSAVVPGNLPRYGYSAALLLTLAVVACQPDRALAPDSAAHAASGSSEKGAGEGGSAIAGVPTEGGACPACAFGPRLYTRDKAQPITDAATFTGNPAGAYLIEIDDLGTQGANATVILNGVSIDARSGHLRKEISLGTNNELLTRLTGKPGSKLTVSIYQEVHSVTVTPNRNYTRIPATQQFTAVARDKNGVVIPSQTFEWSSSNTSIATITASSGVGRTTGEIHNNAAWTYETISTGEGTSQISARAIASTVTGSVPWKISSGFVYTTFRAPRPFGPNRHLRPSREPFRYSVARLGPMEATCASERSISERISYAGGMGLFFQCFPVLEMTTSVRYPLPFGLFVDEDVPNVGLYGRYCGAGHPSETFVDLARGGNHQPKDPIDAMCMEHDRQSQSHDLSTAVGGGENALATCIVRYGILHETLHEDGVLVEPLSERWFAFWAERPEMFQARLHFLVATTASCGDDATVGGITIPGTYSEFLRERPSDP